MTKRSTIHQGSRLETLQELLENVKYRTKEEKGGSSIAGKYTHVGGRGLRAATGEPGGKIEVINMAVAKKLYHWQTFIRGRTC